MHFEKDVILSVIDLVYLRVIKFEMLMCLYKLFKIITSLNILKFNSFRFKHKSYAWHKQYLHDKRIVRIKLLSEYF